MSAAPSPSLAPERGVAPRIFAVSAIAFDLDGTLLDTVHDLAAAVNALLAELGLPPLPKDEIRAMIGKGMANLVRRALARAAGDAPDAIADAELAAALDRYQAHYAERLGRETRPFPGMVEGLDRLAAMGFALAVVTNKASRFVRPHLEQARHRALLRRRGRRRRPARARSRIRRSSCTSRASFESRPRAC